MQQILREETPTARELCFRVVPIQDANLSRSYFIFFNFFKHCAFWVLHFLLPFSLVSSSCIFSNATRTWRRDFCLQYRKSLVPLYEVEDWLEAGGIDPQTWADQHTWEEQRFPSETKATAWDFFWRWKKFQHYTPPASPTFSPTASLDQPYGQVALHLCHCAIVGRWETPSITVNRWIDWNGRILSRVGRETCRLCSNFRTRMGEDMQGPKTSQSQRCFSPLEWQIANNWTTARIWAMPQRCDWHQFDCSRMTSLINHVDAGVEKICVAEHGEHSRWWWSSLQANRGLICPRAVLQQCWRFFSQQLRVKVPKGSRNPWRRPR